MSHLRSATILCGCLSLLGCADLRDRRQTQLSECRLAGSRRLAFRSRISSGSIAWI
jgi:hypothetical protein